MDIQSVDRGHELGQRLELRLRLSPVVVGGPMVRELAHRRERHALRMICDGLLLRPLCGDDPATQVGESLIRRMEVEWPISVSTIVAMAILLASPSGEDRRVAEDPER